ncbi:MAG: Gfo/Idh/MocA family protein, partial [Elsteraceae bacterium]
NCHIKPLQALPGVEVVAVADLRPALCASVGEALAIPHRYPSHAALLAHPGLDAVVVVTRPQATGPVVLDCLDRGVHVLSEKPMAHALSQARRLSERARAGQVYAVGFMKRCDPGVLRARRLIQETRADGRWGALVSVQAWSEAGDSGDGVSHYAMTAEPRPDGLTLWPLAPDWLDPSRVKDFAAFCNVHSHMINLLPWLMAASVDVEAADATGADRQTARGRIGDAALTLSFFDGKHGAWREGFLIRFEGGQIRLDLPAPFDRAATAQARIQAAGEAAPSLLPLEETGWAFDRQSAAFVAACRGAAPPPMDGRDGPADLDLTETLWRSAAKPLGRAQES